MKATSREKGSALLKSFAQSVMESSCSPVVASILRCLNLAWMIVLIASKGTSQNNRLDWNFSMINSQESCSAVPIQCRNDTTTIVRNPVSSVSIPKYLIMICRRCRTDFKVRFVCTLILIITCDKDVKHAGYLAILQHLKPQDQ